MFPTGMIGRRLPMRAAENPTDAQAAAWVARLDRSGTDESDHPELQRWLAEDGRHRGAFVRARAMWQMLDGEASAPERALPVLEAPVTRRALVAGLAACVVGGATLVTLGWPRPAEATMLRTGFGEIRRFGLSGGGQLVLDGTSAVALHHDDQPRLDLLAGAAWIDLGPASPTLGVVAGGMRLSAVASSLALRHDPQPEVIVAKGFVDLLDGDAQATRLGPGARARRGADSVTRIDQLSPGSLDRMLAWRTGDIDLDGETVAAAADRFNLYNRRRIVIADTELAGKRVVGRFTLHRPDDFADAVAAMYGGNVSRTQTAIRIDGTKIGGRTKI
jgi:transmembrane sensor